MDWEHVLQIRKARELSHPNNTSDNPSPASAGGGFNVPNLNDCEQLVFRMRAELIDYIEAHGLVDGLMWDGVLMPTQDRKIVISAEMVDQLVARLGFMKEKDVRGFLEVYLPENDYVQDGEYVHTDNNFTDEEKAGLAQAITDIADIKEHEEACDAETKEKFEEVDGRLGALEERADGFDKDISGIISSCQSLDLRVSDLETDIDRIDEVLDTHGSAINRLTASSQIIFGRVDKIEDEIAGIKDNITDIDRIVSEHAEAIDGINGQLEGVGTDLSGIHTWMDTTDRHQEYQDNILGTLNDRMDTNEEAIAALIKSDVDINEHLRQIDKDHRAITLTCQQIIQDVHALKDVVAENKQQSEAADSVLRDSIAQEASDRASEDSRLEGLINMETSLRETNDNILKKAIEDEASIRGTAVAELDMKLEEEARIRKETDDELRAKFVTATGMIADISHRIDTEISDINREVELVNGAIAKEISDREAADDEIKAMISEIEKPWPKQRVGLQISSEDMTKIREINGFHKFQAEITGGLWKSYDTCFGYIGHYKNSPQIYVSMFLSGYIDYNVIKEYDVGFSLSAGFVGEGSYEMTARTFELMLSTEKEFNLENKIFGLREIVISDEEIDLAAVKTEVESQGARIESLEDTVSMLPVFAVIPIGVSIDESALHLLSWSQTGKMLNISGDLYLTYNDTSEGEKALTVPVSGCGEINWAEGSTSCQIMLNGMIAEGQEANTSVKKYANVSVVIEVQKPVNDNDPFAVTASACVETTIWTGQWNEASFRNVSVKCPNNTQDIHTTAEINFTEIVDNAMRTTTKTKSALVFVSIDLLITITWDGGYQTKTNNRYVVPVPSLPTNGSYKTVLLENKVSVTTLTPVYSETRGIGDKLENVLVEFSYYASRMNTLAFYAKTIQNNPLRNGVIEVVVNSTGTTIGIEGVS